MSAHPWETIYAREGRIFTEPIPAFGTVVERLARHGCRQLLDLGCGNGRHLVALRQAGFTVVGLDISASGLRLSREWLQEERLAAELVRADVRRSLPFRPGCFDGLISIQVIHHALLAEVQLAIREIGRVLAPQGIAFVTVAGQKDAEVAYDEIEPGTFVPLTGPEKGLPHHIFSEGGLRAAFGAFQVLEINRRAEGRVLALWIMKR